MAKRKAAGASEAPSPKKRREKGGAPAKGGLTASPHRSWTKPKPAVSPHRENNVSDRDHSDIKNVKGSGNHSVVAQDSTSSARQGKRKSQSTSIPATKSAKPSTSKKPAKATSEEDPTEVESVVERGPSDPAAPTQRRRRTKEEKDREVMPLAARAQNLQHFIGAHVSIAKGVHNSVHNALHIGGNAFALFLKSQRKWESPPMQEEHATLFQCLCTEHGYSQKEHVLPHGSYLVNLASVNPEQQEKSITSFLDDMKRCSRLGIKLYNFHPGNTNGAPRDEACARIAEAIDRAHAHVTDVIPVLETMASNKPTSNVIGSRFEDLAAIIGAVKDKSRVGVCIDTCHIFAAGYDIVSEEGFKQTMQDFDTIVGRKYLRAWHLNDSKAPFGSGRDLHANIGTGFIGLKGFWNLMNMHVWGDGVGVCGVPMVLETPIDESASETATDKTGKTVTKAIEDKNVWAKEIKLLESLVGLDPTSKQFTNLEQELCKRGREQREKIIAAVEKKKEKDRLKDEKAKSGKGKKKNINKVSDELSENSEDLGSELSEFENEKGKKQ